MDNSKRPINQIIARINDAAKHGEALVLTAEEQVVEFVKEGKLGQKINNTKD